MVTSCSSIVALILLMTTAVLSNSSHQLRQFSAGSDAFYASNAGKNLGAELKGADCKHPENVTIANGQMVCLSSSGCAVKCDKGYRTDGSRTQHLGCDPSSGTLTYLGKPWKSYLPPCIPHCKDGCPAGFDCIAPDKCKESACDPPCQNGGTCIIRDVCNCPQGYSGLLCQEHRCDLPKPRPIQATIGASSELTTMDIHCNLGFKMNNGLTTEVYRCHHHQWITLDKGSSNVDFNCYS